MRSSKSKADDNPLARAGAFLARKERFENEVRAHLADFTQNEVDEAVRQLRDRRFLDDHRAGRNLLATYAGKRSAGNEFLLAALIDRGCEAAIAAQLITELEERESESQRARTALNARGPGLKPATAARFLASRGFSEESIEQALEDHFGLEGP